MQKKTLNITNGDCFNDYFITKFGGAAIPFCEAMMDGETTADIFSEEFVALRARSLNVSEAEYRGKMYVYDYLSSDDYQELRLWFGKDTFCQMNLLTLLAYLEQISYSGKVTLNYIDDETFEVTEANIDVQLGIYSRIYEDALVSRKATSDVGALCAAAIDLFFDYRSEDGKLMKLIRANATKEKPELIRLLLEESRDYGLSDLQAEGLINSSLEG